MFLQKMTSRWKSSEGGDVIGGRREEDCQHSSQTRSPSGTTTVTLARKIVQTIGTKIVQTNGTKIFPNVMK